MDCTMIYDTNTTEGNMFVNYYWEQLTPMQQSYPREIMIHIFLFCLFVEKDSCMIIITLRLHILEQEDQLSQWFCLQYVLIADDSILLFHSFFMSIEHWALSIEHWVLSIEHWALSMSPFTSQPEVILHCFLKQCKLFHPVEQPRNVVPFWTSDFVFRPSTIVNMVLIVA